MVIFTGQIRNNLMNPTQSDFPLGLEQSTDSSTEHQIMWIAYVYGPLYMKTRVLDHLGTALCSY